MAQLTQKHVILIRAFMNADKPLKSEVLSVLLGINVKTLKNYLDVIDEELSENGGARLASKSGIGLYLDIFDQSKYDEYYQEFHSMYAGSKLLTSQMPLDARYIAIHFVLAEGYITIDDLAEELYKSRKSVLIDIASVERILDAYHLSLLKTTGKGFICKGKESHKRHMIADYVIAYDVFEEKKGVYYDQYAAERAGLIEILKYNCIKYGLSIPQRSLYKIARIISVSRIRLLEGYKLENSFSEIEGILLEPEYECAVSIYRDLQMFDIDNSEVNLLAVLLISRRYIVSTDIYDIRQNQRIYKLSGEVLDYVLWQTGVDFTQFPKVRLELANHIRSLEYRLKYGFEKRAVKVVETKGSNLYYEFAVVMSEYLAEYWATPINDYEIAYLAYVFYSCVIDLQTQQLNKILVLSREGKEVGFIIKRELTNRWNKYISSVTVDDTYMLPYISLSDYDLLVTDTPNITIPEEMDRVFVNAYMNQTDIQNLEQYFEEKNNLYRVLLSSFDKNLFFANQRFESQKEVIDFIVEKTEMYFPKGSNVKETIIKREKISSSEFNNSCVVMNSYTLFSSRPHIMVITLEKPIIWRNNKVQVIVFVINSKSEQTSFFVLTNTRKLYNDHTVVYETLNAKEMADVVNSANNWLNSNKVSKNKN